MSDTDLGPATPEPSSIDANAQKPGVTTRSIFLAYATGGLSVLAGHNQNPDLRVHAFQAAFYLLAALAAHALLSVFGSVLAPFRPLFDLATVGFYGYLLWLAWEGKPLHLPVIGAIARKQAAPTDTAGLS